MHIESGVFIILIFTILFTGIAGHMILTTAMDTLRCIVLIFRMVGEWEVVGILPTAAGDGVIRLITVRGIVLMVVMGTIIIMVMEDIMEEITIPVIMVIPIITTMGEGDQRVQML